MATAMAERPLRAASSNGRGRKRYEVTEEHKEALAEGRVQSAAVRRYLEVLTTQQQPTRRGRRTEVWIERRLAQIEGLLPLETDPISRLSLFQERLNLRKELEDRRDAENMEVLEAEFIKHAAAYARRKGISRMAFRQLGVPAPVLRRAGVIAGS